MSIRWDLAGGGLQLPPSPLQWGERSYTDLYVPGLYIMTTLCIPYMCVAVVSLATFCTFQLFPFLHPSQITISLNTTCSPAPQSTAEALQPHRASPPLRAGLHSLKQLTFSTRLTLKFKVTLAVSGHQMRYLGQIQQNPSLASSSHVFTVEQ